MVYIYTGIRIEFHQNPLPSGKILTSKASFTDLKLYIITIYYQKNGYIRVVVGWMSGLVGGLQNHIPRFESGTDLYAICISFKN